MITDITIKGTIYRIIYNYIFIMINEYPSNEYINRVKSQSLNLHAGHSAHQITIIKTK